MDSLDDSSFFIFFSSIAKKTIVKMRLMASDIGVDDGINHVHDQMNGNPKTMIKPYSWAFSMDSGVLAPKKVNIGSSNGKHIA